MTPGGELEVAAGVDCWAAMAAELKARVDDRTWNVWFGDVQPLFLEAGVLRLYVPSAFHWEWIRGHFAEELKAALAATDGVESLQVLQVSPSFRFTGWWRPWNRVHPNAVVVRRGPRRMRPRSPRSRAGRSRAASRDGPRRKDEPDPPVARAAR